MSHISSLICPQEKKNPTCKKSPRVLACLYRASLAHNQNESSVFCQYSFSLCMFKPSSKHLSSASVYWLVNDGMGENVWGLWKREPLSCESFIACAGHASHKAGCIFVLSYCLSGYVGLQTELLRYIMCWLSPIIATVLGAMPKFRQICMNSRANEGNKFKLVPGQRSNSEVSFKWLD